MLGQVAAALELGNDPQHRQQETQVARHRRLQVSVRSVRRLDVGVEVVDELIAGLDLERRLAIARQERVGRRRQALGDEREQLDDLGVDLLELASEVPAQVIGHEGHATESSPGVRTWFM